MEKNNQKEIDKWLRKIQEEVIKSIFSFKFLFILIIDCCSEKLLKQKTR